MIIIGVLLFMSPQPGIGYPAVDNPGDIYPGSPTFHEPIYKPSSYIHISGITYVIIKHINLLQRYCPFPVNRCLTPI